MIELACVEEAEHQLGIDYAVGDGRQLMLGEKYDLAVAGYLLNYARDRHELGDMCNSITCSLKSDGRFVTVNCNLALDFRHAPSYRKYGFDECRRSASSWRAIAFIGRLPLSEELINPQAVHINDLKTPAFIGEGLADLGKMAKL